MFNYHTLTTAALYFTIFPLFTSFGPPTLKGKGLFEQHQYNVTELYCQLTFMYTIYTYQTSWNFMRCLQKNHSRQHYAVTIVITTKGYIHKEK